MSKVINRHWPGSGNGLTRSDRLGCDYEAYVPDLLCERSYFIDGEVAASVAEAEAAMLKLNASSKTLTNTEALARILLRAEAVASSRIEGLELGARRLLQAEAARESREEVNDVTAAEVLSNIDAMSYAIGSADPGQPITLENILTMNKLLLSQTKHSAEGGLIRDRQNWIGGSAFHPCSAKFVPPPEDLVLGLMEDLVAFCNQDGLPPVVQAAIVHAQFETIHPFVDGNGRTGRALIHVILKRRGLADRVLTPVSLILATWAKAYVEALSEYRYRGEANSPAAHFGLNAWISQFANACTRACADAETYENRVQEIQAAWHVKLGKVRKQSSVDLLIAQLPGLPVFTISGAAKLIGRTFPAVNSAVQAMVSAGILTQTTIGKRNRAYEAAEIIEAFTGLERQLGSPQGDTRSSKPARRVPHRPL